MWILISDPASERLLGGICDLFHLLEDVRFRWDNTNRVLDILKDHAVLPGLH